MLIDELVNVAARCVHSSLIKDVDSIVYHLIPSKTENLAICSGGMWLFTESENDLSLLTTVNSGEPLL